MKVKAAVMRMIKLKSDLRKNQNCSLYSVEEFPKMKKKRKSNEILRSRQSKKILTMMKTFSNPRRESPAKI